jgi:hypothetical protein
MEDEVIHRRNLSGDRRRNWCQKKATLATTALRSL